MSGPHTSVVLFKLQSTEIIPQGMTRLTPVASCVLSSQPICALVYRTFSKLDYTDAALVM